MRAKTFLPWFLGAALAGCASTPSGPPEEIAPKIVALLDANKRDEAKQLFESAATTDEARDQLYPLLYETAHTRYDKGQAEGSVKVLRFMAERYPKSKSVNEALIYALFLQRAGSEQAPPELVQELGTALTRLRKMAPDAPAWIELVEAQQAIDRGQLDAARAAFTRFQQAKKDPPPPPELTVYVEDIDRYLKSHQ